MEDLIKETLDSLTSQNIPATPRNYAKEFYKLAKSSNRQFDDLNSINFVMNTLTEDEIDEISEHEIVTASDLIKILAKRLSINDTSKLINHLSEFLKPSIDESIYSKIEEVIFELMKEPSKLLEDDTLSKMLNITNERIELDREVLKDKSNDIKKFITLLVNEYEKSIILSNDSGNEIKRIKNNLNKLKISDKSNRELEILYSKLTEIVYDIENNINVSTVEISKARESCIKLEDSIERLKKDLEKLKKEKDIDFLTTVLNRRGYTSSIVKIENKFSNFNSKYAVVFLDIDDFKEINDNYGHDNGDKVLKIFANILRKTTRESDVVARYGGEEFVVLISYKNEEDVIKFVKRIKEIVNSHKFICSETLKIDVRFSAGVSFREKYNSYEDTIKYADILLYKAKHEGKNKAIIDNGSII